MPLHTNSSLTLTGVTFPFWMTLPGSKAYLRRFGRSSKSELLLSEVERIHVNPKYANFRNSSERKLTVMLKDLAPCPSPAIHVPSRPPFFSWRRCESGTDWRSGFWFWTFWQTQHQWRNSVFYLGVLPEPLKGFFRKDLSLMNETVANSGCAHVGSVCVLCFLLVYRYYIFFRRGE